MSRSNFVNQATRLALYKRDSFTCLFCNKKLERDYNELTLDHIIARSKVEGTHETHNLVTCCRKCNSIKQDLTVWEFCLKMNFDFIKVDQRLRKSANKKIDLSLALQVLDYTPDYKTALKAI